MNETLVDARGKRCPAPIIALAQASRELPPGTYVVLLSDDPGADTDVPAWCRLKGVDYLGTRAVDDGAGTGYVVRLPQ